MLHFARKADYSFLLSMMFAGVAVAIGCVLALLVLVLISTCIALVECQRGQYSLTLVVYASIPIVFAVVNMGWILVTVVGDYLITHDSIDFGTLIFSVSLSAPFFCAGWWALAKLRQNKRNKHF
jgi:hypothetical protein